ncbi:flagellar hook-basal body complex protein FliE [Nocardioides sp. GY 10113]|nr:flagellar hook-basal body complex protein FliE [Nocardioides sp. GY 10113]
MSGSTLLPTDVSGVSGASGVTAASRANGAEFGDLVIDGIDRLEGLTDKADHLAVQAATGQLDNIHDYTIAASEAQVATQLTVALRNKALEAFNEIMRMQV